MFLVLSPFTAEHMSIYSEVTYSVHPDKFTRLKGKPSEKTGTLTENSTMMQGLPSEETKIKTPSNAFFLYRYANLTLENMSVLSSQMPMVPNYQKRPQYADESEEVRAKFTAMADVERRGQFIKYPH
jgi:hypothetical protein